MVCFAGSVSRVLEIFLQGSGPVPHFLARTPIFGTTNFTTVLRFSQRKQRHYIQQRSTNTTTMGRLHSNGKGISASAIPYSRTSPAWLKTTPDAVVDQICKLAKKGATPSQIGVVLRDSHGIAQVKIVTGMNVQEWRLGEAGANERQVTRSSASSKAMVRFYLFERYKRSQQWLARDGRHFA